MASLYFSAEKSAIQKYKKILETNDVRAFDSFASDSYYKSNMFKYRQSFFEPGTSVSVDLGSPGIEITRKTGDSKEFTVKNVPCIVCNGERKITVTRDITFKKQGLFSYGLESEDVSCPVEQSNTRIDQYPQMDFDRSFRAKIEEKGKDINYHVITKQVLATIYQWKVAWVSKNLDTYMSFYSDDAQITRVTVNEKGKEIKEFLLTKETLRARMEKLNERYEDIVVEVFNPEVVIRNTNNITHIEEIVVEAKFGQLFSGGNGRYRYTDFGNKILRFRNQENQWKIVEESWKPRKAEMAKFREIFPELFKN
jgi:hypothetical protein